MAKKRATKRKAATDTVATENDENNEETNSVENGDAGSSKSTSSGKKKKSVTAKSEQKNETPKNKAKSSKTKSNGEEDGEEEEDYEVEKILDVNYKKNGKREFLIRWKNYSAKHDTWEPEDNLSCDELITKFLEVQEKREKQPRKDLRERPKAVTRYTAPAGRKSKRTAGNRKSYTEQEEEEDE